jgi:hypothetical protein
MDGEGIAPAYEYKTEVLPLRAGDAEVTTKLLCHFASLGWRMVSSHPMSVNVRSELDPAGPKLEAGLFVVFERFRHAPANSVSPAPSDRG